MLSSEEQTASMFWGLSETKSDVYNVFQLEEHFNTGTRRPPINLDKSEVLFTSNLCFGFGLTDSIMITSGVNYFLTSCWLVLIMVLP